MATGTRASYTDTTNNKRGIIDMIYMVDWTKAPLLNTLGFTNANTKKFRPVNWPSTKLEWLEDSMRAFGTTMNDSGGIDGSALSVTVTDGTLFRQGDVVGIHASSASTSAIAEKVLVTAVNGNDLTIVRSWGDPAAAVHADGVYMSVETRAMPEGSDYVTGYTTTLSAPYNYTQILSEAVKSTRTSRAITKYGIEDDLAYQVAKLFKDGGNVGVLPILLEKTFYSGERTQRTSSAGAYGSMGGFEVFVTTNVTDLSGAALTRKNIHDTIRSIRDAGGDTDILLTNSWGIEKITSMYEETIRTTRDETRGGSEITMIKTPHGEVELVYSWLCPQDRYYFINREKCGWLPFYEFNIHDIPSVGDWSAQDIVGEYTFFLTCEESHGLIKGASITT